MEVVSMRGMRKMSAKFRGRCKGCGGTIAVGSEILWSKQTGAFHDNGECYVDTVSRSGGRDESIAEQAQREMWDEERDWEAEMIAREEREYQQGYHDVAAIHAVSAAGSELREQLYRELEQRDYDLYG